MKPGTARVALVGSGFAATCHLDALRRVPGVEVAVLVGRDHARAREAAERLGLPRSTGDLQNVLSDQAIDAVHNCTPNHLHAGVNAAVLSAGKHLVAEKPLGISSVETADLVRRAQATEAVSAVCFNYRYFPMPRQVRSWLAAGDHGVPHLIHGSYLQDWLVHPTDWNWRLDSELAGRSRAVADIGSHWMDLMQFVTGRRIESVYAQLGRLHERRIRPAAATATFEGSSGEGETVVVDTEDTACVVFTMEGGCLGSFIVSQVSPGRKNHLSFQIDTEAAAFSWDQEEPNTLWIGHRDGPNELLARDPLLLGGEAAKLARFPGGHQEGWPDALRNMFEDVYATVAARAEGREPEHEPSFATFADAHRTTLAVEAILESDRSGRRETVGTRAEVDR